MSERIYQIFFFLLFWQPLYAQQLEEGLAWKPTPGYRPVLIAGQTGDDLWLVNGTLDKTDGIIRDLMLERLDAKILGFKEAYTFPGLFADRQQFYPEGVITWNDTVRILGSSYDKVDKRYRLFLRNLIGKGTLGKAKEIFSFPASGYIYNKKRFGIESSSGQKSLAVWGFSQTADSMGIYYTVFDSLLKPIKQYSLTQKSSGPVQPEQVQLDGYGNFHLLLSQALENKQQGRSYTLYAFPVLSEEVVAYQIELPDKRISSIAIQMADDDQLIAAGYYTDLFRKEEALSGYFFLRINRETGEIPVKEVRLMDQEFYNLYSGQDDKPTRRDMDRLKLRKVLPVAYGGCMLLSEQEWTEERCETDVRTGLQVCDSHYFYGSLILQHFGATGSMDWLQILRKQQHSVGDEGAFSSCILQTQTHGLSLYFNFMQESSKGGKSSILDPNKSVLGYFRTDASGQDEKGVSRESGGFVAIPATAVLVNGTLYFLGEKEGSRKLFRSELQP